MKKLGIIAVVLLGLYGCWYIAFPWGSWRYRLTLVVETPEGIKTGSAVREVYAFREPKIFPEQSAGHAGIKGEAVAVDLGQRGVLFALLKGEASSDYGSHIVFDAFPSPDGPGGALTAEGIRYYSHLRGEKKLLQQGQMPMLVRFRNINDPTTVEKVDPNDLAKNFGPGVKFVSATIEMTDDTVANHNKSSLRTGLYIFYVILAM